MRVEFAVVGNSAVPGGSVWRGRKKVTCCRAVSEEGGDCLHGFKCWGALVVEVRGEEGVDRGER
jgi:hypothetical protein